MIKTKLKKNDLVKVVAGNSKGSTGKILFIDREKGRVIVEGVNIVSKHQRPTQKNPNGGILKREAPIGISNVMYIDPKSNNPTRLGSEIIKDEQTGKIKRMRKINKSGEILIS